MSLLGTLLLPPLPSLIASFTWAYHSLWESNLQGCFGRWKGVKAPTSLRVQTVTLCTREHARKKVNAMLTRLKAHGHFRVWN